MERGSKMKIDRVFIAMWHALSTLYDERPDDMDLEDWVFDADPYKSVNHRAFIPEVQERFESYVDDSSLKKEDYTPEESYGLIAHYLDDKTKWATRFSDITLEEWGKLCELVDQAEDAYFPIHVETFGAWVHEGCPPADIKGKTIKSIEYVKVDGQAMAHNAMQINLGRTAARIRCLPFGSCWVGTNTNGMRIFMREYSLNAPFAPEDGTPHAYMVDEVVTGVEQILYAVTADGYEGVLAVHMGVTLRTRYGVHSFYRSGMTSDLIHVADHVPSDEELGMDEVTAFWSEGTTGFSIVRDDWEL